MNRESLFRLALVTHSNAPRTLNKYIALLAKLVIVESDESHFTINSISKLIKRKFNFEFLDEEIKHALKFDNDFDITEDKKNYSLKPEGIQGIKDTELNTETLENYLKEFLELFYKNRTNKEKDRLKEIIMQYLYYSFNSGRNSLVSLLTHNTEKQISEDFNAPDDDKKIINDFLDWDKPSKNECIYSIVSYCIDYGMLTAKKDIESYKKVFEGVHFFLDANIILRLIGLNNLERQEVTQHFINKCKEVGIELCYSNFSFKEIFHVIGNAVKYVKYVNNGDRPIAPSDLDKLGEYDNKDFYEIYYNWCKEENNRYDNYDAYHNFLKQKVISCLDDFIRVDANNEELTNSNEFLNYANSLMVYKNKRNPIRPCTIDSAKIDVNNFLLVKQNNSERSEGTLNTRSFLISADWRFYDWTITILPGVPLVFMPSEWLSIILKYTSRTDSDYNTFCQFMNLRLSYNEIQKQRTMSLIHSINELTSDVDVKQRIIHQITESSLSIPEDEYEEDGVIVKRAFDIVIEEQKKESGREMNKRIEELNIEHQQQLKDLQRKTDINLKDAKLAGADEAAATIVITLIDRKLDKWVWIKEKIALADGAVGILSFVLLLVIATNNNISNYITKFCCPNTLLKNKEFEFSIMLSAFIASVLASLFYFFINYMSSTKRKQKMIKKKETKYKNIVQKIDHLSL
jgi:hypothetical protein